jgi:hypothetical protein
MNDNANLWGLPQPAPVPCNFCGVAGIEGEDIKYLGTMWEADWEKPVRVRMCKDCLSNIFW